MSSDLTKSTYKYFTGGYVYPLPIIGRRLRSYSFKQIYCLKEITSEDLKICSRSF